MSAYPFWSLKFDVRDDISDLERRVLAAVARDEHVAAYDQAELQPIPRYYLADWRRMSTDEQEPKIGSPIRLARGQRLDRPATVLSIEFCQHDDEFANGGWVFLLWVMRMVARPDPGQRVVIGCHGLYRGDYDTRVVYADTDGIDDGRVPLRFDDLESSWDAVISDDSWDGWHP